MQIKSNLVDIQNRTIYPAIITVKEGLIDSIVQSDESYEGYTLPGFIDAHVHIESSMLTPANFAKIALGHGTVATISDPHEIANVLGIEGIEFMIDDAQNSPLKFHFGAPSCVPATTFETSGATIDSSAIKKLLERDEIKYLSEMMNFPGVLFSDPEVMAKIEHAKAMGKPIDGHAPGLRGDDLSKYIDAGISTDHEAYSYEEGLEKIEKGMKILIREGSAAKNYDALKKLIDEHPDSCMFCSDDKHPDDLMQGHINSLVKRSIEQGYDLFSVLQIACINPIVHYGLDVGKLQVGDSADFIVVDNLEEFNLIESYIDGSCVYRDNQLFVEDVQTQPVNNFHALPKEERDFRVPYQEGVIRVIQAIDHELITKEVDEKPKVEDGFVVADVKRDILKIALINRYQEARVVVDFIEGFELREGAIASSIAHDSHNIIAVGCDDASIAKAVNAVIVNQGAIVAVTKDHELVLPLDIAGLMSSMDGEVVAQKYQQINRFVKEEMGSKLDAPFMTLSFMALLVIPELKLSDKGLFDSNHFAFTDLFCKK